MNPTSQRLIRKGLFLAVVLGLLALVGPLAPPKPALACTWPHECLQGMYWNCDRCYCECPIDPWGDPADPSNCGPCV
jgi:hypothetical protein